MINFPSNPVLDQVVVLADKTFKFDGTAWRIQLPEPTDHATITNKQGGTTGEYYHLTAAELTAVGTIGTHNHNGTYAPSVHSHAHNDTTGIQGGGVGDYQHLTTAQLALLGAGGATISDTAPGSPASGDLWFDSVNGVLAIYYNDGTSSQWVDTTNGLSINPSLTTTPVTVTYNASGTTTITLDGITEHFKATAATGPTTWAISGTPSGQSTGFILDLTNGGSQTQNWPAGTLYDGGIAPSSLTAAGKDRFIFQYDGVAWSMFVVSKDIK